MPKNYFFHSIPVFLPNSNQKNMNKRLIRYSLIVFYVLFLFSCKKSNNTSESQTTATENTTQASIKAPAFSADSSYFFTEKQVSFGPRVPGTQASVKCGDWLVKKFKEYKLEVTEQKFNAVLYNGKTVPSRNIIASYNPKAAKRIILASHWDSRPFGDKDKSVKNKPIDGANDGASSVAVLLEIARVISKDSLDLGIDFILFDSEDWGAPEGYTQEIKHEYGGWCLGSEYWAKNLHKPNYSAYYGILLDMVGAKGATFPKEGLSAMVAPSIVQNIWNAAGSLGFSNYFVENTGAQITDDHVPVNTIAKIPMIDIIDMRNTENLFFEHHHTMQDNMESIDKNTLKAVGQTILQVLYNETAEI